MHAGSSGGARVAHQATHAAYVAGPVIAICAKSSSRTSIITFMAKRVVVKNRLHRSMHTLDESL